VIIQWRSFKHAGLTRWTQLRGWLRSWILTAPVDEGVEVTLETLASVIIPRRELFAGDGVTKNFTVVNDTIRAGSDRCFLSGEGLQRNGQQYTLVDAKTLSFTLAPPAGSTIAVYFLQEFVQYGRIEPDFWPANLPIRLGLVPRRDMLPGDATLTGPIYGLSERLFSADKNLLARDVDYSVGLDRKTITFTPFFGPQVWPVAAYYLEAEE
jgi:hypothetical protein